MCIIPKKNLGSSKKKLLIVPKCILKTYGHRASILQGSYIMERPAGLYQTNGLPRDVQG